MAYKIYIANICQILSKCPTSLTNQQLNATVNTVCQGAAAKDNTATVVSQLQTGAKGDVIRVMSAASIQKALVLAPPTDECYSCNSQLVSYHTTKVKVFSMSGVSDATKYTLRCMKCKLFYRHSHFGNKDQGFQYYPEEQEHVEVNDTNYFERKLCELQCCLAWVSGITYSLYILK